MSEFFLFFNGSSSGPHSAEKISDGISNGNLDQSVQFSSNENGPWTPISQFQTVAGSQNQSSETLETLKREFQEFRNSITTRISQIEAKLNENSNNNSASSPVVPEVGVIVRPVPESITPPVPNSWNIEVDRDPITDGEQIVINNEATEGVNPYGKAPKLFIRSVNNQLELWVYWGAYFSEDDNSVTHRVGTAQPITMAWTLSSDNQGTFFPSDTTSLVRALLNVERLVIRALPYNESPITAVFNTTGLRESIRATTASLDHLLI